MIRIFSPLKGSKLLYRLKRDFTQGFINCSDRSRTRQRDCDSEASFENCERHFEVNLPLLDELNKINSSPSWLGLMKVARMLISRRADSKKKRFNRMEDSALSAH